MSRFDWNERARTYVPRLSAGKEGIPFNWIVAVSAMLFGVYTWDFWLEGLELSALCMISTVGMMLSFLAVVRTGNRTFWSPPTIFLVVALLFHGGAVFLTAVGLPIQYGHGADMSWFTHPANRRAIVLATEAFLAFALGALVWSSFPPRDHGMDRDSTPRAATYSTVGFFLLLTSCLAWALLIVSSIGLDVFSATYSEYRAGIGGGLPYAYLGIGVGGALLASGAQEPWLRRGMFVFAVFAMLALTLGLRGSVLFPAATLAAVLATRRRLPRGGLIVVILLIALTLINVLQQTRQTGIREAAISAVRVSPVSGLGELGSTLRVVAITVDWHDYRHEPFRGGDTYWAPIDRGLNGTLLGLPIPANDPRLMSAEIQRREGPLGGSFIAESYHNLGDRGVLLVSLAFGFILALADRRRDSVARRAVTGVVLYVLLRHVRNEFTPVPFQLIFGLAVVAACEWLSSLRTDGIRFKRAAVAQGELRADRSGSR